MLDCFGISRRSSAKATRRALKLEVSEQETRHIALQERSTLIQEDQKTHVLKSSAAGRQEVKICALKACAADTHTASSAPATPSSITVDTPNATPAAATHRASPGSEQVHLHALLTSGLDAASPGPGSPCEPASDQAARRQDSGQHCAASSMIEQAQPSNRTGDAPPPSKPASTHEEPLSTPALSDPCSKLSQAVSRVLACASVHKQELQNGHCISSAASGSGQGVEPLSLPHKATPAAQAACHTITLASLEQASCSQAPNAPLALLVLGHQHGSGKLWQSNAGDGTEQTTATKQLQEQLRDTAMELASTEVQGNDGAQLKEGIMRGTSAGADSSTVQQTCKDEMGSCVWLNSAFSQRLEAPSMQAALATTNQSISSNLTIQRHIAGFCRNMELGKQDPVCFWSLFNPMSGLAQVERICMWPCELLVNDGSSASQQDAACSVCRSILISVAGWVSRDMQYDVLLHQHMAYQSTPTMVTVLSTEGCILTQNAESVASLGCHSKEHSSVCFDGGDLPLRVPHQGKETLSLCEPSQPFCYLKELFYDQEDLLAEMLKVVGEHEPFVERMELRSPLLRAWLGAGEDEEIWHRVHIIQIVCPISHQPQFCLSQMDVTDVILAEQHVLQLQQQQGALLKEILPQQVVERLLLHKSDLVKSVPKKSSPKANLVAQAPPLQEKVSHHKPPAPSTSKGKLSQALRSTHTETQQGGQVVECQPAPMESTFRRVSHSSSARRAMRSLQDLTKESPASQSTIPRPQAPRSMSSEKMKIGSPPTAMLDRPSPQESPASLDVFRSSMTSSLGQQQAGLEQGSIPSSSGADVRSPEGASGSQQPPCQAQPMQDAASGMTWLTQQDVMDLATFHDNVTILFADIKGFTSMVNQLHPSQVMLFLNSLYSMWDSLLEPFGVYKIETIGDCYMCCTGLFCYDEATGTKRLGGHDPQHARTMLEFAKAMICSSQAIKTPLGDIVQVRVGIHSGSCSSGVVGQRMPRWCLFGDTVNTANRMESNGLPGCIHASEATVKLLDGEPWKSTGGIVAKGKGLMQTSLLPILPGAADAAAASIAQRHSANGAANGAEESSSAPQLGSISGEARMSDGQSQHGMTGSRSSASGVPCCSDKTYMQGGTEMLRMPTAAAAAASAAATAAVSEQSE